MTFPAGVEHVVANIAPNLWGVVGILGTLALFGLACIVHQCRKAKHPKRKPFGCY